MCSRDSRRWFNVHIRHIRMAEWSATVINSKIQFIYERLIIVEFQRKIQ